MNVKNSDGKTVCAINKKNKTVIIRRGECKTLIDFSKEKPRIINIKRDKVIEKEVS